MKIKQLKFVFFMYSLNSHLVNYCIVFAQKLKRQNKKILNGTLQGILQI